MWRQPALRCAFLHQLHPLIAVMITEQSAFKQTRTYMHETSTLLCSLRLMCFQVAEKAAWIEERYRHRVAEILGFMHGIREEVSELQTEDDTNQ